MEQISVEELARWRAEEKEYVLLDVREPFELAVAALPEALHIPMREIPRRLGELRPDSEIAVLCHHGGRSEYVAQFLATRGFSRVHNVEGGIDAYARRIDPSLALY